MSLELKPTMIARCAAAHKNRPQNRPAGHPEGPFHGNFRIAETVRWRGATRSLHLASLRGKRRVTAHPDSANKANHPS